MNYGEIITEVEVLLQDSSPEIVSRIPGAVNEALRFAADEVDLPSLKSLVSIDTVVDQAWASLPDSSADKILKVSSSTSNGSPIEILSSLEELLEYSPSLDYTGDVEVVALDRGILYYQGIPASATTLLVLLFTYPAELSAETDVPDHIPLSLHRKILVHGAASIVYEFIEDGSESADRPNTNWHAVQREDGIVRLRQWRAKNRQGKARHYFDV